MKYVIANWKANKTLSEAIEWIQVFLQLYKGNEQCQVILCPPYPLLVFLKERLRDALNIELGAQDVSMFDKGPYTGEVTACTIAGLVKFSLIGHSERRSNFHETEGKIEAKIANAHKYSIEPILCIRDVRDRVHHGVRFVTYEPESAISTGPNGVNASIENVLRIRATLQITEPMKFIYGGNVNDRNCSDYLNNGNIDGVLVGAASLNPHTFHSIVSSV